MSSSIHCPTQISQVTPLPISSGVSMKKMHDTNNLLSLMQIQEKANTCYDPLPPPTSTPSQIIQKFCSGTDCSTDTSTDTNLIGAMILFGSILIVYGIVSK